MASPALVAGRVRSNCRIPRKIQAFQVAYIGGEELGSSCEICQSGSGNTIVITHSHMYLYVYVLESAVALCMYNVCGGWLC